MRLSPNDRGAHLYVLQAETGYIKVGRSDDPQKRARSIQAAQASEVILVHVAIGLGPSEVELLTSLARRRVRGEWIDGTLAARDIIEAHVGQSIAWPYRTPNQRADVGPIDHELLTAEQATAFCGISRASFYRSVKEERLPAPVYPTRNAPRWFKSDLANALQATRARPIDAAVRRMTKRRALLSEDRRIAELSA